MRFVDPWALAVPLVLLSGASPVHQQRYCMGTMFDIVAYHPSRPEAERALAKALDEVERLDAVMSHFKPESDLSRLNRVGRHGFVTVDPALYDVIVQSVDLSRQSAGKFDVTIAPVVTLWKDAREEGGRPSATDIAAASRCVGYEGIVVEPPDRIRFRSDCLQIELGGIGKGFAVQRALAVLESAGIRDAVVNGGSSSIAAIGAPPGLSGWPVRVGGKEIVLRDASISTSQQDGAIIDPRSGSPASSTTAITVSAPDAALADALSTALVVMTRTEGARLLERFPGVSAIYADDAR